MWTSGPMDVLRRSCEPSMVDLYLWSYGGPPMDLRTSGPLVDLRTIKGPQVLHWSWTTCDLRSFLGPSMDHRTSIDHRTWSSLDHLRTIYGPSQVLRLWSFSGPQDLWSSNGPSLDHLWTYIRTSISGPSQEVLRSITGPLVLWRTSYGPQDLRTISGPQDHQRSSAGPPFFFALLRNFCRLLSILHVLTAKIDELPILLNSFWQP